MDKLGRVKATIESLRPVIDILKAWGEAHQERLSCAPAPEVVVKKSKRAA